MYWNHRVVKHVDTQYDETTYLIHEVYYEGDDEIVAKTQDGVAPMGDTLEELRNELMNMLAACEKEILDND